MSKHAAQTTDWALPEVIETAVNQLCRVARIGNSDSHFLRAHAALVAAINAALVAGRADTARLDAWERERWALVLDPDAVRLWTGNPSEVPADFVGEGPTLRDAIDDATRKETI